MKKIALLLFFFLVCSINAQAQIQQVHRHIIVLYDLSGSSGNYAQPHDRQMRKEVNSILEQLLTSSELNLKQNAHTDRDLMDHYRLFLPLFQWEKNGRLDFLPHGINAQGIQQCDAQAKSAPDFILSLAKNVFRHSIEAKNPDEVKTALKSISSLPEYDFQMIRYAYPLALSYMHEKRISADTVVIIQVSDFVSGEGGIGLNDRLAIRDNSRNKVEYIENEVVKFFNNNFQVESAREIVIQRPINPANPMLVKVSVMRLLDVPVIEIEKKSISLDQEGPVLKMNPFGFSMYITEKNRQKPVNQDFIQKKFINFHLRNSGLEEKFDIDFRPAGNNPNTFIVQPFDVAASLFKGKDQSVGMNIKFDMVYNPDSYWKGTFYYSVQSAERDVILNREGPPGLPWWVWAIIIVCIPLILYLIYVFFIFKPLFYVEITDNQPDQHKIAGLPEKIPVYEWDEELEYRIEFDILNKCPKLFFKKISGSFRLRHRTTGNPHTDELFKTGMYLSREDKIYELSEDPPFVNIAPGQKSTFLLFFKPGNINEPERMPKTREDCFEIEITVYAPGTKNVEERRFFRFALTPKLNSNWLAIDPGTTGTCLAYGQPSEKIRPVKMEENSEIMPTAIYFKKDGNPLFGQMAVEQITASPENGFFSIKKLIGYQNARTVIVNGKPKAFTGEQITELLISHLYDSAKEFLREKQIDKVVIAVPNYYTPVKIQKIKDIINRIGSRNGKPQIHKTLHIYEAEAVALYFIKKYRNEFIYDNEDILIFDFGGGTINVSIVSVKKANDQTCIEIEGRVGYAIGGDTIDRIVAEYLYENIPDIKEGYNKYFGGYSPFSLDVDLESNILNEWRSANTKLKKMAKELKEKLSLIKKGEIQQEISLTLSGRDIRGTYTFQSSEIEEYIKNFRLGDFNLREVIQNSINEVLDIFNVVGDGRLETAILSGRSSQLPFVEKLVISTLQKRGQQPQYHPFTGNETKTCVAEGAVYYGSLNQTEIRLSRPVTLANYGLKIIKNSRPVYESIININRSYVNDAVTGEATKINIIENGGIVPLYQVNGANPTEAVTKDLKYKTSILLNLNLRQAKNIERITMNLTDKDTYDLDVKGAVNIHLKEKEASPIDLFEDNLDLALWPFDKKAYNYKPSES